MRVVVPTDEGVLELNWQWLPTWMGMNAALRREMSLLLAKEFEGKPMTSEFLDEAHVLVVSFLEKKFPAIRGTKRYLDALKYIEYT